jgi:glycosyltransferase involved in cell wall biosynthesis
MLERQVHERGLSERSRFLGVRRGLDLVEVINACDAYLITSRSETQSMTMLQAAACGLPVVAVRAGGLPEYVKHSVSGYLVEPDDRAGCASFLGRLLVDPDLARRFGRAGRDHVSQFSPVAVTKQFEAVYAMALTKSRHTRPADRNLA